MRRIRSYRPSHTTVAAYLSLFLVLTGGTAVALNGSNTVFSDDIRNGEVKNPDVAANAVGGGKVIDNSLTGNDVQALTGGDVSDNSLKGDDIDEPSLGQVPSAASASTASSANTANSANSATNAQNTNGLQLRSFHYAENANSALESIFSLGGVSVGAGCDSAGNLAVIAQSHVNDSYIRASNSQSDADFDNGQQLDLDTPDNDGVRTFSFRKGPGAANSSTLNSNSVSVSLSFDEGAGTGPPCQAAGTGVGRP